MSYTIESIVEKIGARRLGNKPAAIDWLLTDSRSLCFPEETLFFAIPTKCLDLLLGNEMDLICSKITSGVEAAIASAVG